MCSIAAMTCGPYFTRVSVGMVTQEAKNLTPENSKGMRELTLTTELVACGSRARVSCDGFWAIAGPHMWQCPTALSSGDRKMEKARPRGLLQGWCFPCVVFIATSPALDTRHLCAHCPDEEPESWRTAVIHPRT